MGACDFYHTARGTNAKQAFINAREKAQWDHGHSGYTGTIAEKSEFVMISLPENTDPIKYASDLIGNEDPRIDDKWGPAGCIDLKDGSYLFFGWASS